MELGVRANMADVSARMESVVAPKSDLQGLSNIDAIG